MEPPTPIGLAQTNGAPVQWSGPRLRGGREYVCVFCLRGWGVGGPRNRHAAGEWGRASPPLPWDMSVGIVSQDDWIGRCVENTSSLPRQGVMRESPCKILLRR